MTQRFTAGEAAESSAVTGPGRTHSRGQALDVGAGGRVLPHSQLWANMSHINSKANTSHEREFQMTFFSIF